MALLAQTGGTKKSAAAALGGYGAPAGAGSYVASQLPGVGTSITGRGAPAGTNPYVASQLPGLGLPAGPDGSGGGSGPAAPKKDPYLTDLPYLQALAAEQTGSQNADDALRAAQEQAIIGYGDPSLAAALGITSDPNIAAAARQNYLAGNSTLARLDRQHGLNQQQGINNEVSRGMLFSGDTGYQRGQIDQQYGNNVYDAQQALLNQNQQWQGQNLASKQQLRQATIDALNGAYNRFVANPGFYGQAAAAGTPAATPAAAAPALAGSGDITSRYTPTPSMVSSLGAKSRLATTPGRNPGRGLIQ